MLSDYETREAMQALRGRLSRRATSSEFNEWSAREVCEYIDALRARISSLEAENAALRESLEPFAEFAGNVNADGWLSNIHREQISTWFGPSDFYRARKAQEGSGDAKSVDGQSSLKLTCGIMGATSQA